MFAYHSVAEIIKAASDAGKKISDVALEDQAAVLDKPPEALIQAMRAHLDVMRESAQKGAVEGLKSWSGLTGGAGFALSQYATENGKSLSGSFCAAAIAKAVAIAECNAAMGKIVAAPTAGSCGILPAAVLTMMEQRGVDEDAAVMALFTAGAIGMVIAKEACIAGAEGGCQAECGSAAAMCAAALVELSGGTPEQAGDACAIALKNQLGLVCDPVAGLVEVPCVKRNAGAVMEAICAADIALAGVRSVIPVDEVIAAMREVGDALPSSLKETAQGGLAATPTGIALKAKIFGKKEE
jgi:L-serine dehydratase